VRQFYQGRLKGMATSHKEAMAKAAVPLSVDACTNTEEAGTTDAGTEPEGHFVSQETLALERVAADLRLEMARLNSAAHVRCIERAHSKLLFVSHTFSTYLTFQRLTTCNAGTRRENRRTPRGATRSNRLQHRNSPSPQLCRRQSNPLVRRGPPSSDGRANSREPPLPLCRGACCRPAPHSRSTRTLAITTFLTTPGQAQAPARHSRWRAENPSCCRVCQRSGCYCGQPGVGESSRDITSGPAANRRGV